MDEQTDTKESIGRAAAESLENSLLDQILHSTAAALGRKGDYSQGIALLQNQPPSQGEKAVLLDLEARMYAQQGRFQKAENCWIRALKVDENNPDYIRALSRIDRMKNRPVGFWWLKPVLAFIFVLLLFIGLRFAIKTEITQMRSEIRSELAALEIPGQPVGNIQTASSSKQSQLLQFHTDLEGVTIKKRGSEIVIVFNEGLFKNGATLTREGSALLTRLGSELEAYLGRAVIYVEGHSDNLPMGTPGLFVDNTALALARSSAVVNHLRIMTRLPGEMLPATSSQGRIAPFPNDTRDNRMRNRTVVLHLAAKKEMEN